jgi:hypothetical protein
MFGVARSLFLPGGKVPRLTSVNNILVYQFPLGFIQPISAIVWIQTFFYPSGKIIKVKCSQLRRKFPTLVLFNLISIEKPRNPSKEHDDQKESTIAFNHNWPIIKESISYIYFWLSEKVLSGASIEERKHNLFIRELPLQINILNDHVL